MAISTRTDRARPAEAPEKEWPFERRFLEVDGHRVHYLDEGEGPVLLFVHAGMWSFIWRDAIARLRGRFRCVALDLPGSGYSEAAEGYVPTVPAHSRVLDRFVRALDLEGVTMVVHDLGGPTAFLAAAREPQRVKAMVVASTFGWPLADYPFVTRMLRLATGRVSGFFTVNFNAFARATATGYGVGRHLSRAGKRAFLRPYRSREARRNSLVTLKSALAMDHELGLVQRALEERLGDLPVLTIWGEKNLGERRTLHWQDRWSRMLPRARAVTFQGSHHFPMADDPDRFAEEVRRWFAEEVEGR